MAESSPLLASIQGDNEEFPSILHGKKVLLATESWGPVNGVSRTTRSLVEYLRDHGVELILVAPHFKGDLSKQSTPWEYRLPGCALPYNPDLTVVYPFQINDVFQQTFQPDIVYLASPASLGFQMLLQIRQLRSPPPVLLNFQTDLSAYAEIMLPTPWTNLASGCWQPSRASCSALVPCTPSSTHARPFGATWNAQAHPSTGWSSWVVASTPSCSPPRNVMRPTAGEIAPAGEIILICVCRIAPEKGFEFLAQVATRLAADKVPFKLLIVGGNRNPVVENKVKRLFDGIRNHVVFTGFLTGSALARAYASADLFLHCSITETFGLVVLEAMASGLPVIARDQGGPSDIIRHGQTGYLVPPHDLNRFTDWTREVSQDSTRRRALATAARQYADDTTWEKINRRAAWQIADALTHTDQESHGRRPPVRPGIMGSTMEYVRLAFAVGIVYAMWLIAVVPLIVHGHRFIPRAWQALRDQFQCAWPLRS
ncbi:uncharacterized protein N7482_006322 [Penicillium canariense]|uniref:Uncharacterized protein n=1 Tax=Penicillium canariense TaxID=189055 RepID=A0A9W9I442_9EURO|nr:uncharacterized protein N7482_006322 [Penicillium canariense]KAJ5167541.1 hypothetical protein N7482_006322 [Penicillium canariense]